MPQFNSYPLPALPLTGSEVMVIVQQQGNQLVGCTAQLSMFPAPQAINFGPTSGRPVYAGTVVSYFDTDLGIPIWGTEDGWFNAAGSFVGSPILDGAGNPILDGSGNPILS